MRRVAVPLLCAAAIAVMVVSCETSNLPTRPDTGSISATIFDGANDGNTHFLFLPPMVPSPPSIASPFNPALKPVVEICELDGVPGVDPSVTCGDGPDAGGGDFFTRFEPSEVELRELDELYVAHWKTDTFPEINDVAIYRVSVIVEDFPTLGDVLLGFADVDVAATQEDLKLIDENEFVPLLIDRTLPIKFRIGIGFYCEAIGAGAECGEAIFDGAGGTATTADGKAGVSAQALPVGDGTDVFVAVERVTCPIDSENRVDLMPVDIPQYGQCVKLTSFPELTQPISPLSVVGVCLEAPPGIAESESNYVLRSENPFDPTAGVYAGPHRDASNPPPVGAGFLDCDGSGGGGGSASANTFLNLAYRGWKAFNRAVNPLHAVPVYAGHEGEGGGFPEWSYFNWGHLPEMAKVPGVDGTTVQVGATLNPQIVVTNFEGARVPGASVTFTIPAGFGGTINGGTDPVMITTGSNGIATLDWVPGPASGIYQITGTSMGMGVHPDDGGSGPQFPPSDDQRLLVEESVTFEVLACVPGGGIGETNSIDGVLSEGEWDCAVQIPAEVNLGGGKKIGTFYHMRDNDDLFFALKVPVDETAAEKQNIWTLYLNDGGAAELTLGDDVLAVDATAEGQQFSDQNWTDDCPKGQSFCAVADAQAAQGEGAFQTNVTVTEKFYFYEIRHPSASLDGQDITFEGLLSAFWTLRVGKGAKGNTEWPDAGFGYYESLIQ